MTYYEAIRAVADAMEEAGGTALPPLNKLLVDRINGVFNVFLMYPGQCLFVECESWVDSDGLKALVAEELGRVVQ